MILRDSTSHECHLLQSHFAVIFKDVGSGKSTSEKHCLLGRMLDTSLLLPQHSEGEETRGRLPHQPGRGNRHLSQDLYFLLLIAARVLSDPKENKPS